MNDKFREWAPAKPLTEADRERIYGYLTRDRVMDDEATLMLFRALGAERYWREQTEARTTDLLENGRRLNALIVKAQALLAAQIEPGGPTRETCIDELLGLLDGPEQREAQEGWYAAVGKAIGPY